MVVVAPKLSQERKIASVETSAVPCAAIVAASSVSISIPCSSESTPPATPSRAPARSDEWAVTLTPRAWAAATTGALRGHPGRDALLRAVEVELEQIDAIVELADRVAEQLGGIVGRHDPLAGYRPGLIQPRAGGADIG